MVVVVQYHAQCLAASFAQLLQAHVIAVAAEFLHQFANIALAAGQCLPDAVEVLQYAVLHLRRSLVGESHRQRVSVFLLGLGAHHQVDVLHGQRKRLAATSRSLVNVQCGIHAYCLLFLPTKILFS